jgi:hypothetical protein
MRTTSQISNFSECVATGNAVMESFPRKCIANGKTYTEIIDDQIGSNTPLVTYPLPNQIITSPLDVSGNAPGTWFFEAVFPLYIVDSEGNQISQGIAQAQGDWMTEALVPFSASLTFDEPASGSGELVLQRDNPSDLPQNTEEIRIPIRF